MSRAPAIMAAKAARAPADEKTSLSRAAYYPTLTAQLAGNASTVRDTQAAPPPSDQVFVYQNSQLSASGGVSLRWTLWDFGRTSNAARAADEGLRAAEAHEAASDGRDDRAGHGGRVEALAFAGPDELWSASWDGSARRWDLAGIAADPKSLVAASERRWSITLATRRSARPPRRPRADGDRAVTRA